MKELYGFCEGPLFLIHGGAGPRDPDEERLVAATDALETIARDALRAGNGDASALPLAAMEGLEAHEMFNAGFGAALQSDGQARLTAAWMDGSRQSFSAVIGAQHLHHPSRMAHALQQKKSRVLAPPGSGLLAREMGIRPVMAHSMKRAEAWLKKLGQPETYDTVGCVVRTARNEVVAATSTGGRGGEFPGRVSDSATVAGNYASRWAAISATGIGEQIVDDAVAVRIESRVRDGMSLEEACHRGMNEAVARQREYGWIAVTGEGHWAVCHTTPAMSFVVMNGEGKILAGSRPGGECLLA